MLALFCMFAPLRVWALSFDPVPLAVTINGTTVSDGTTVLRESGGTYALAVDDARSWRLVFPRSADESYDGQTYVALRLVLGVVVAFDEASQRLDLTVPPRYFALTRVDNAVKSSVSMSGRDRGAFVDYDMRAFAGSMQPVELNTILDSGLTLGDGVLNADFIGSIGNGVTGLRRVSTSWQRDDVTGHTTLRIGDAAGDANALIPEQPFLGAQIISNFSTAPSLQLNERPSVSGMLASAANADIYVDGKLVLQQNLPAGPFLIDNVPVSPGSGQVQVVTKDATGHEQVITSSSYYTSSQLLRRGFSQFSLGAGLEGIPTDTVERYGAPIVEAFEQRGFTDRFTGEFNTQIMPGGTSLSSGGVWLLPGLGTFDAALTAGAGAGSRFDYAYVYHRFSFGFGESSLQQNNPIVFTPGFQAVIAPLSILRTSQFHLSFPTSARSSIALSMNEQSAPSSTSRILMLNYFAALGHRMQMNFALLKTSGSLRSTSATLQLSMPLDAHRNATISAGEQNGLPVTDLAFSKQAVFDGQESLPGYAVSLGSPDDISAQLSYTKSAMDLSAGFSQSSGIDSYQLDAQGSIAAVNRHLLAARNIEQAYGIAVIPGYAHIRVYVNSQFAGVTDAHGAVLLSNLQPYQENTVTLDSRDLPITANIQSLKVTVVPYYHTPVIVRFPVRGNGGIILHVKMPDGSYLPSGATLQAGDSSWAVADEGEAYLDGIPNGPLSLSASGGDIHCMVQIDVPKDISDIPDLGDAVCR
jgi:outer membrane usher protein